MKILLFLFLLVSCNPLSHFESFFGIDDNSNGIRDDVDRWLENLPASEIEKKAILEYARSINSTHNKNLTSEEKSQRHIAIKKAMDCLYITFINQDEANRFKVEDLKKEVLARENNTERRELYYYKVLSAKVSKHFQNIYFHQACNFEPSDEIIENEFKAIERMHGPQVLNRAQWPTESQFKQKLADHYFNKYKNGLKELLWCSMDPNKDLQEEIRKSLKFKEYNYWVVKDPQQNCYKINLSSKYHFHYFATVGIDDSIFRLGNFGTSEMKDDFKKFIPIQKKEVLETTKLLNNPHSINKPQNSPVDHKMEVTTYSNLPKYELKKLEIGQIKNHKEFNDEIKNIFNPYPYLYQEFTLAMRGIYESYSELSTFKELPNGYGQVKDEKKWIVGKRRTSKANGCMSFLMSNSSKENKMHIFQYLDNYKKLNNFNKLEIEDFKVMLNREIRRAIQKDIFNIKKEEQHILCSSKIPPEFLKKEITYKTETPKKLDLSFYHPRDQKIIKSLLAQVEKENKTQKEKENYAFKTFLRTLYPIIESKASMEFLPHLKKICPEVLDKYWAKCKDKKGYFNLIYKNVPKMYCILDHETEIDKKCFDPKSHDATKLEKILNQSKNGSDGRS